MKITDLAAGQVFRFVNSDVFRNDTDFIAIETHGLVNGSSFMDRNFSVFTTSTDEEVLLSNIGSSSFFASFSVSLPPN